MVINNLINKDQTGFIKGRYIGENIRLIYDLMNYTEENNIPGLLLLIDFEKRLTLYHGNLYKKLLNFLTLVIP